MAKHKLQALSCKTATTGFLFLNYNKIDSALLQHFPSHPVYGKKKKKKKKVKYDEGQIFSSLKLLCT